MNEDIFGKGANDRPEDFLKPRAWRHEEIAGAFQPAPWLEKDLKDFDTYPKRDQEMQSSCVLYTASKLLSIDELTENGAYRELSPRSIYPYVAVPGGGSNSIDAMKIATKRGMTLEVLLPTDGLSEAEAVSDKGYVTDAKQVALVYKPDSFVECTTDFETIASILNGYKVQGKRKAVAVTVVGSNNGTWLSAFPKPPKMGEALWYHKVPVCDYGLIGGKKHLSIDNSWGTKAGLNGQQFLSIDYQGWMYGGIYTLNMPDDWQQLGSPNMPAPKYQWTLDMSLGSSGKDVEMLQVALQSMGMFPISSVMKPTGFYGGMTKKSVELFQASFGIETTGTVGPKTRAKLNDIFK